MKAAEFEEKEYEAPLYNQLERANSHLWTPGQVLEEYLGFDVAMLLDDPRLWELHGRRRPMRGFAPYWFSWPFLPRPRRRNERLPRFRLNCFIQAKRCEFGRRVPKHLKGFISDRRPIFRFAIASDQQQTLEAAAAKLQGKALFVYAAPAFSQSRELFSHMTQGTIVQHSTFPDVLGLVGHGAWYYNEPGSHGAANPDSERLQFPALDERIASLIESASDRAEADADASPSAALASLRREIQAVVSEGDGVADSPRAAYLAEEWRAIDRFAQSVDAPPALTSFLGVEAFVAHFNLVWLAIQ